MASLKEYRDERLIKLNRLKELGFNPYPAHVDKSHEIVSILDNFDSLSNQQATIAGRIISIRSFGKLVFIVIKDASGSIQLFIKEGLITSSDKEQNVLGIEHVILLDTGDFVQATGKIAKTKTGEKSIEVESLRFLAKAIRPMPKSHESFTNKEERLRRRYIDLNVNDDVFERFKRRSFFWQSARDYLLSKDFMEINIPVLEQTTGGADANPFMTHMNALDQDFYLRISHELPLKRLIGGGYEKVFDIGPRFRNENYSDEHLPEHVAMEWYWAYADWQDGMKMTREMIRSIADKTWGKRSFELANGQKIDLGSDNEDWPTVSFVDSIKEQFGLNVFETTLEQVQATLKEAGLEIEKFENKIRGIDKLWKKIRTSIVGPTYLVDIPSFLQPLAKLQAQDSRMTEQFNLILGGTEVCKAYSELNDPIDQLNRFKEQQNLRDAGDKEAQMMDIDFVEMLEYGMPPACGYGHSERLFWVLEGISAREGVPFPHLRREIDEVTKSIYPDLKFN